MPIEPTRKVYLEQSHLHRATGIARQADDLVDRDWRRPEQLFDYAERSAVAVHPLRFSRLVRRVRRCKPRLQRAHCLEHVTGVLDQSRALADQLIAALRARIERRTNLARP
jgi:hypothetical protein